MAQQDQVLEQAEGMVVGALERAAVVASSTFHRRDHHRQDTACLGNCRWVRPQHRSSNGCSHHLLCPHNSLDNQCSFLCNKTRTPARLYGNNRLGNLIEVVSRSLVPVAGSMANGPHLLPMEGSGPLLADGNWLVVAQT